MEQRCNLSKSVPEYDVLALTAKIRKKLADVNKRPYVKSHIEKHSLLGPVDTNF